MTMMMMAISLLRSKPPLRPKAIDAPQSGEPSHVWRLPFGH